MISSLPGSKRTPADGRRQADGRSAELARAGERAYPRTIASDSLDLQRFIDAQEEGGTYQRALAELQAGRKESHWMWFVFPQVEGLGSSPTARRYAIGSLAEARAFLDHPLLGARLRECTEALLAIEGRSAEQILGGLDALKLRSSMTLFGRAAPQEPRFRRVLERYFGGVADPETERLLDM